MVTKEQHILVTGATGFIGSYICRLLLHEGFENVHALCREGSSYELLEGINEKIVWHKCDMLDVLEIDKVLSTDISVVIHSAAIVSFSPKDDARMIDANMRGTRYLVDGALAHRVERFIHISSVSALGKEISGNTISENSTWTESKNNSPYSISKKSSEMEVWRGHAEGLNVAILNPSIVLGAGIWKKSSVKIFGNMIKGQKLYPAGSNGFVDVRDVAKAVLILLNSDLSGKRILLNAENMSFKNLMDKIAEAYEVAPPTFQIRDWMIPISWRLMSAYSFLTGSASVYNKYSVISSSKEWVYDNSLSTELLGLNYIDMEKTIQETAQVFLKSKKENKTFGILPLL